MNIFKNILSVIVGWIGGSILNMGLVQLGHMTFPIKDIDVNDMQALAQALPNLEYHYFIFPFLAHALGTFLGSFLSYRISSNHHMRFAMSIGIIFLVGGIAVNIMLPGALWFTVLDLLLAYLPMAWLGGQLAKKLS
jgi:hypothetical protein